jgi:hypothetical protein
MENESAADEISQAREAALFEGYREMAADEEREMEAEKWIEHILFDLE